MSDANEGSKELRSFGVLPNEVRQGSEERSEVLRCKHCNEGSEATGVKRAASRGLGETTKPSR